MLFWSVLNDGHHQFIVVPKLKVQTKYKGILISVLYKSYLYELAYAKFAVPFIDNDYNFILKTVNWQGGQACAKEHLPQVCSCLASSYPFYHFLVSNAKLLTGTD